MHTGDDHAANHAAAGRTSTARETQQINLALKDVPTLCEDHESSRDKVALVGSKG